MSIGGTWSIPMDQFIGKGKARLDVVARKIVLTAFRRVIMRTPVLTGRARGGWQCSTGTAPVASGEFLGEMVQSFDLDKSGRNAVAAMTSTVSQEWNPLSGEKAILANNVPYIDVLENGRVGNRGSNQAPNGMVRITVAELGGIAQDAAATFGTSSWDIGSAGE